MVISSRARGQTAVTVTLQCLHSGSTGLDSRQVFAAFYLQATSEASSVIFEVFKAVRTNASEEHIASIFWVKDPYKNHTASSHPR
jgi:hypothetical protein